MLIHRKRARAVATVLILLALAGCAKDTQGTPSPTATKSTPTRSPSSGTTGDQVKAPTVKQPLDASKFSTDPCRTLTQSQVQQLEGSKPGTRSDSNDGVGCMWNLTADGSAGAGVSFVPKITNGLTFTYQQNAAHVFEHGYFEPTEVDGYPAAFNEIADLRSSSGQCGITVGISDQTVFLVQITWRAGKDACAAAMNVAKAALHTIQGGQ